MAPWASLALLAVTASPDVSLLYSGDSFGFWGREGLPGGFARRKAAVDAIRAEGPVVLLDSGNALGQSYYARTDWGELSAELFNLLSYDAIGLGPHDLDYGEARLSELTERFELPWVSTNIDAGLPVVSVRRLERGGVSLAIFGVSNPRHDELHAVAAATVLRTALTEVRDDDLVVVLSGLDYFANVRLAAEVDGIDVIVSSSATAQADEYGHVQSVPVGQTTTQARPGSSTLIVPVSRYGFALGRIDVTVRDGGFSLAPSVIELPEGAAGDAALAERIERRVREVRETVFGDVLVSDLVGTLGGSLDRVGLERAALHVLRDVTDSEVALLPTRFLVKTDYSLETANARNQLVAYDIQRMVWTDDAVVKATFTGAQLRAAFERAGEQLLALGVDGERINGRPLAPAEEYTVATTTALASEHGALPELRAPVRRVDRFVLDEAGLSPDDGGTPMLARDAVVRWVGEYLGRGVLDPYPPQWRVDFERLSVRVHHLDVRNNQDFDRVRDARVRSEDQLTIALSGRVEVVRESRSVAWINSAEARFERLELADDTRNKAQDHVQVATQLTARALGVAGVEPFAQALYETQLARTTASVPRRNRAVGLAGVTTTLGGALRELKLAPAVEVDFSVAETNVGAGAMLVLRLDEPVAQSGVRLQADADVRYLPYFAHRREDSLVLAAEVRARVLVPIFSYLYVAPEAEVFVYRGAVVKEVGTNLSLGIGITFSRLWKPETSDLLP